MTELLNVGKRIKRFRISRSMTQKALGMAVGFPQETALSLIHISEPTRP